MAGEDDDNRKCFTFIWKLENARYISEDIESPLFTVDELNETKWKLEFYPHGENRSIAFYLRRQADNANLESVKIDCDLAFLSYDGGVLLQAWKRKNVEIRINEYVGEGTAALRNEVFFDRKSVFLSQGTLEIRCRIWNSVDEMPKDVRCIVRTGVNVQKMSFQWNIESFSTFEHTKKKTYDIKSPDSGKNFMSLELFLSGGLVCDETVRFKIIPNYQNMKMSTFKLSIIDASKNFVKCFEDEFWHRDSCSSKDFALFCTNRELLENNSTYLPDDVLSMYCECAFYFGTVEIEKKWDDSRSVGGRKKHASSVSTGNEFFYPKCTVLSDLKSMFNNDRVSDVKLKTKSQTYPAHKSVLSARSPVFKAMFSNDTKEKTNDCVEIEDLTDDTVKRMLRFIYSAEIEGLDWASATELYEAADNYEILSLKVICSSFLKKNLGANNSCQALLLADLHQDENLKCFVQEFITRHNKDIINSEEWGHLAGACAKLAYETLFLKFKKERK